MIDINLIRENKERVKENLRKRNEPYFVELVDKVYEIDLEWRNLLRKVNQLRAERNKLSKEISKTKDKALINKVKEIKKELEEKNSKLKELEERRNRLLYKLPNLVDDSVPIGPDENFNKPVKYVGIAKVLPEKEQEFKQNYSEAKYVVKKSIIHHADLITIYDLADTDTASKTSGARFYYEKNEFVLLDLALSMYALKKLYNKGFKLLIPPYLVNKWVEAKATSFDAFEDTLYKIEGEDLYLIPTAEHPLGAYFSNTILRKKDLPIKLAGFSPCFRREAGSHGKDTKGIFRTHIFHKVEQYIITVPEKSFEAMDELIENSGELLQELNIPYRIILLCSGDMDKKVIKQYDIEGWFPGQNRYRELMSFGNVTDWQARRLMIRYQDGNEFKFVHTIYGTALAIQRTLLAMLENNIDEKGVIHIPKALQAYLPFKEIKPKKD